MAKKKSGKGIAFILGSIVVGGGIGYGLGNLELFGDDAFEALGLVWTIVGMLLIAGLVILIHELGHVIGGAKAGFTFAMLVVGLLRIMQEEGRLKFRLNTALSMAGGLALMLPTQAPTKQQLKWFILGGPIASWIGAVVFLLVGWLVHDATTGVTRDFAALVLAGGLMSVTIGCFTLLPSSLGGFDSDGAQWRDVRQGGHRAERKMLMYGLLAETMNGVRPREWTQHLIEQARALQADEQNSVQVALTFFLYQHDLDAGRLAEAEQSLKRMMALRGAYPKAARGSLYAEDAFFNARFKGQTEAAQESLVHVKGAWVEKNTRLRAAAAVAWSAGRFADGTSWAEEALALLDKNARYGNTIAEREWLEALAVDCRNQVEFSTTNGEVGL